MAGLEPTDENGLESTDVSITVQWLQRIQSRHVWVAFGLAMAFNAWFFTLGPYADMGAHGGIIDERFGSSPGDIEADADAYSEAGRSAYRTFLVWDLGYALFQGVWLTGFIAIGTRHWRRLPTWTVWLPVAAVASDWLENIGLIAVLAGASGAAGVAFIGMHVKLVANIAAFVTAIAIIGFYVMHPVKRR